VRRLDRDAEYVLVQLGHPGKPEWVWRPSAYSRSPLYPMLHITTETGELFVDLAGAVYDTLPDTHA
jgi:hypothetical protein